MGGIKQKGANFMRGKLSNVHPKDVIKTQSIFTGDLVQVVTGNKDVGKRGKVIDVLKRRNLIVVEGIGMQVKHVKPNPFYPTGGKLTKETPIHYSRVQLVDPTTDKPTSVTLKWEENTERGGRDLTRFSKESQQFIPIPKKEDKFKKQEEGPRDTTAELVQKVTFTPNVLECPFPPSLMNELERMKRKNIESVAI